jgi:transposase
MAKKYIVKLTDEERSSLTKLISSGKTSARKINHARILLKADDSNGDGWSDGQIAEALDTSIPTIERIRKVFVEKGIEEAINNAKRTYQQPRKLDGVKEAYLIALTCSEAPEGHGRWTLRLLADKMVELNYVGSLSHETVRKTLKKTS